MSYVMDYSVKFYSKCCESCKHCNMESGFINEFKCELGNSQTSFDMILDKDGNVERLSFPARYILANVFDNDGNHDFEAEKVIRENGCEDFQKFSH